MTSLCDDEDFAVPGYCPGCGTQALQLRGGKLLCEHRDCPTPDAAAKILSDPEIEHIVVVEDASWNMKHPLRERINDELLDCAVARMLRGMFEFGPVPVPDPGTYRVTPSGDDKKPWKWETL